jgi:hypothetical protein
MGGTGDLPDHENDDSKTLKSRRAVLEILNGFRRDLLTNPERGDAHSAA